LVPGQGRGRACYAVGKDTLGMEADSLRCGFIALLGRPNVGKSTLMNRILEEKVSITSSRPQTTRNRILGIHTYRDSQAVYMDTPGIHDWKGELNQWMVEQSRRAAADSDVAVMMIEADRPWRDPDLSVLELVEKLEVPRILVINKVDKVDKPSVLPLIRNSDSLGVFHDIVPLSALKGDNVDRFQEVVRDHLPEGPALFPEDMITDQAERFWVAEVVREKVVRNTREELPFSTAAVVTGFSEDPEIIRVQAEILVEKKSQKGIIIGSRGRMIKKIGSQARQDLEKFFGKQVFVELYVRVSEKWWKDRDTASQLGMR
ncbi:MAG: GTPase Era, partial [bacterium]